MSHSKIHENSFKRPGPQRGIEMGDSVVILRLCSALGYTGHIRQRLGVQQDMAPCIAFQVSYSMVMKMVHNIAILLFTSLLERQVAFNADIRTLIHVYGQENHTHLER
jgi:hypothetical protein